ncbi:dUTP diphosphatase [uncultured Anaerococcus sp.]|uniref:dUTP diphosphatase n=1 Tax=uncultured Anaerococcus sp. TaxID=293428 RepID=UPI00280625E8|nr:dUTP diphosphatase [uncultured Anaerococcus sp.]
MKSDKNIIKENKEMSLEDFLDKLEELDLEWVNAYGRNLRIEYKSKQIASVGINPKDYILIRSEFNDLPKGMDIKVFNLIHDFINGESENKVGKLLSSIYGLKYKCDYRLEKKDGDQGWDIRATEGYMLDPGERKLIGTSLYLELPEGLYADVRPRSGLSAEGLDVCLGLVDSSYRGEVKVCIVNNSDKNLWIKPNSRIAQIVFGQEIMISPKKVDEISSDTHRGEKGFGSSGI